MGYYSRIRNLDVRIKENAAKEFEEWYYDIIRRSQESPELLTKEEAAISQMWYDNNDRYLFVEDDYAKWGDTNNLVLMLEPYMEDGSEIEFLGEECGTGVTWGYTVQEGIVYDLIYKKEAGKRTKAMVMPKWDL
jgi:hypothetical protein